MKFYSPNNPENNRYKKQVAQTDDKLPKTTSKLHFSGHCSECGHTNRTDIKITRNVNATGQLSVSARCGGCKAQITLFHDL